MSKQAATMTTTIPDKPHLRGIRTHCGWLVRRMTRNTVRVTSEHGYVDIPLKPLEGVTVNDATEQAAAAIEMGIRTWIPIHKASGPSGGSSAARAPGSGLRRVDVYLGPLATEALEALMAGASRPTVRSAIEWALIYAATDLKPIGPK